MLFRWKILKKSIGKEQLIPKPTLGDVTMLGNTSTGKSTWKKYTASDAVWRLHFGKGEDCLVERDRDLVNVGRVRIQVTSPRIFGNDFLGG